MRRAACIAALAALALPGAAAAKGPIHATVCGADRCLSGGTPLAAFFFSGQPFELAPAPRAAPYLAVSLRFPGSSDMRWTYLYVPSRRLIRVDYHGGSGAYWRAAPRSLVHALAPYAHRLRLRSGRFR